MNSSVSGLRLTQALYVFPNGISPHMHGVEPHIVIPSVERTYAESFEKYALPIDYY